MSQYMYLCVYMCFSICVSVCLFLESVCVSICISLWIHSFHRTIRTQGPYTVHTHIYPLGDTGQSVSWKIRPTRVSDSHSHFFMPTCPHSGQHRLPQGTAIV